jgi:hypothetical protein
MLCRSLAPERRPLPRLPTAVGREADAAATPRGSRVPSGRQWRTTTRPPRTSLRQLPTTSKRSGHLATRAPHGCPPSEGTATLALATFVAAMHARTERAEHPADRWGGGPVGLGGSSSAQLARYSYSRCGGGVLRRGGPVERPATVCATPPCGGGLVCDHPHAGGPLGSRPSRRPRHCPCAQRGGVRRWGSESLPT